MVLIIVGSTIILSVIAPANIENPNFKVVTKNIRPNKPYRIEGMPASVSTENLIIFIVLPGFEYSARYMAEPIPIGIEIARDTSTINRVFSSMGIIPWLLLLFGEVRKLQDELNHCRIEEEKEVYRILSMLTNLVESYKKEITTNIQVMSYYDFLFAKGRFSRSLEASPVRVNTCSRLDIRGARHPLIGKSAVPLDISIGDSYRTLVITGPNTGGKTVALKTIGLLTLMVQSGLHVPADPGSEFAVFTDILADIGDGQSIEQSLSTFSSHIRNIISIVED